MFSEEVKMQEGVIAFLDSLGVKGIWSRAEPTEVIESWSEILGVFDRSIKRIEHQAGSILKECHVTAFSDTVIVILSGSDPWTLIPLMAEVISRPFFAAILKGIYFRGVIAIGKFYLSRTLIIGPAVDEAAEWYTHPDWIGVSTAPSALYGIELLIDRGGDISEWFVRYNIPTKSGTEDGWALAWPRQAPMEGSHEHEKITGRTLILNAFSSRPIDILSAGKYRNTLSFFDSVMEMDSKKSDI